MYCIECGAELPDDAKFCNVCGAKTLKEKKEIKAQHRENKIKAAKKRETEKPQKKSKDKTIKPENTAVTTQTQKQQKEIKQKDKTNHNALRIIFFSLFGLLAVLIFGTVGLAMYTDVYENKNVHHNIDDYTSELVNYEDKNIDFAESDLVYLYPIDLFGVWEFHGTVAHDDENMDITYDSPSTGETLFFIVYPENTVHFVIKNDAGEVVQNNSYGYKVFDDYVLVQNSDSDTSIALSIRDEYMIADTIADVSKESDDSVFVKQDVPEEIYLGYKKAEVVIKREILEYIFPGTGQISASDILYNQEWVFVGIASNDNVSNTAGKIDPKAINSDDYSSFYFFNDGRAYEVWTSGNQVLYSVRFFYPHNDNIYKTEILPDSDRGLIGIIGDDGALYVCQYTMMEHPDTGELVEIPISDYFVFVPYSDSKEYGVKLSLIKNGAPGLISDKLDEAVVSEGYDEQTDKPINPREIFDVTSEIITVCVYPNHAPAGGVARAEIFYLGDIVFETEVEIVSESDTIYFTLFTPDNGWPIGEYEVKVFFNDEYVLDKNFTVQ